MSLEDRKTELRREIERKARYLESLESMPDFGMLADGTVLGLVVTFGPSRGYPMIAYKVDGFWFVTGKRGPDGASSDDLAEWLMSGGRHLRSAQVIAEFKVETVEVFDLGAALGGLLDSLSESASSLGRTTGSRGSFVGSTYREPGA
jgi:hypothetical protein